MSRLPKPAQTQLSTRRTFLVEAAAATLFAAGCGADTYEERLKNTRLYFEYLEQVNLALVPKAAQLEGVEIRVPKGFELLAFPPVPKDDQPVEPIEPANDPVRLGYYQNIPLEGVLGTWRAQVRVDGGAEGATAPAYLHLLCNWQRWLDKPLNNDIEPTAFQADAINQLANVYRIADPPDAWDWELMKGFSPFVPKKKVDRIQIQPEIQPPIDVFIHRLEAKDIQVVLVLIIPQAVDSREKVETKFKHTLETMKIASQPPQRKGNKAASGGF